MRVRLPFRRTNHPRGQAPSTRRSKTSHETQQPSLPYDLRMPCREPALSRDEPCVGTGESRRDSEPKTEGGRTEVSCAAQIAAASHYRDKIPSTLPARPLRERESR